MMRASVPPDTDCAGTAVGGPDEKVPDLEAENRALMESYESDLKVEVPAEVRSRVKATPAARRLARKKGIDLSDVASELGLEGVVDRSAVERFLSRGEK